MRLYQRIIAGGIVVAGLAGLFGCKEKSSQEPEREQSVSTSFATISMRYGSGMSMTSGDFDSDGDLDLIVGANRYNSNEADLYRFKNGGAGNFSQ